MRTTTHRTHALGTLFALAGTTALLTACGGDNGSPAATPAPPPVAPAALTCDDSLKTQFKPGANTSVLFVKAFKQGDVLSLAANPPAQCAHSNCRLVLGEDAGRSGAPGAGNRSVHDVRHRDGGMVADGRQLEWANSS